MKQSACEQVEKMSDRNKLSYDEDVYYSRSRGQLIKRGKRYRLIDLFCGAGGLTLGFTREFGHVFEPVWAIDFDDASVATYIINFGKHCVKADILDIVSEPNLHIPQADVVIGGPPCQGFSLLLEKSGAR